MVLVLSRRDVESIITMHDCISVVRDAFMELTQGSAKMPQRVSISCPEGASLYMPAYLSGSKSLACKIVSVYKNNPIRFGLPTTAGKVVLQDPESGEVTCFMDGTYLTAMRTGAASGLATQHLSRNDSEQSVGIFGSGIQARTQLWALSEVRDIAKALTFDVVTSAAKTFVEDMSKRFGIDVEVADSPRQVEQCDIICTATTSTNPVLDGNRVLEGTHINGIGSHTPTTRELDTTLIKRSKLIVDSREACLTEAGDIIIPIKEGVIREGHIHATLGDIISGVKAGREKEEEVTVFKSVGLAVQDAATARLVYERAIEASIGTSVEI
ncbi:MAG: ornithine cyclodeaminase family protein [archaeon]